jgi:LacI family transcriptional regulator
MARDDRKFSNATIIDVANEAGVSFSTVSRVVNNNKHVRPETRERVLNAMMRLGYVVNQQARSLAGGRSQVIGLLVPDVGNGYIGEIIRGVDEELAAAQYELMLYTTHRRRTKESVYVATLTRGLADGLLLVVPDDPGAYLDSLAQQNFPYILVDHQGINDACPAVGATNWQGGYDATTYLLDLGHRQIGFITGNMRLGCAVDRLAAYRAALADHGIDFDPKLLVEGDFQQPSGYQGASKLLALADPPTAIFVSNDMMAFGAMEAVRNHDLRIPEDVSILGFDDIPQAAHVHPGLTTIRQPLEQMGRLATRMLLKKIEDPDFAGDRIELPTTLVIRESCQPPKHVRDGRAAVPRQPG